MLTAPFVEVEVMPAWLEHLGLIINTNFRFFAIVYYSKFSVFDASTKINFRTVLCTLDL